MPRCPVCADAVDPHAMPTAPFCSERCRMIDLGRWLDESYVVPLAGRSGDDEDDGTQAGGSGDPADDA